MEKEDKKAFVLSTRQIILYLADFIVGMNQVFDRHGMYRKNIKDYWNWRQIDRARFSKDLYRLKKEKLVKYYIKDKEKYIELMPKGFKRLLKYQIEEIKIKKPKMWDKKWRIVIFDIPDNKKGSRNILRETLKRLGFIRLQESVFIYPFECKTEIDFIAENYRVKPFLKYIIADILEGDHELLEEFLDQGVVTSKQIK